MWFLCLRSSTVVVQDVFGEAHVSAWGRTSFSPTVGDDASLTWKLRKNCSLSPNQLAIILGLISVPCLIAGVVFCFLGAPVVLVFSILEVCVLALCFFQYARHAADTEWIAISGDNLEVCITSGATEYRRRFSLSLASMGLLSDHDNLTCISESGHMVKVGNSLPRHLRQEFFLALSSTVRQHRVGRWPD